MQMTAKGSIASKAAGAQLLVSACTLSCQSRFYQNKARKHTGKDTNLPVIHLSELVAFALGYHVDRSAQLRTRALVIGG